MNWRDPRTHLLGAAVLLVVLAAWIVRQPLERVEEVVIGALLESEVVELAAGEEVRETFQATGRPLAGVVLYAPLRTWDERQVRAVLYDGDGQVLTSGRPYRTEYRHDKLGVWLSWPIVETTDGQALEIVVTNTGQEMVPLLRNEKLSFSAVHPELMVEGTQRGMWVGVVVALVALSLWLWPKKGWVIAIGLVIIGLPVATGGFWFSEGEWGMSDWDLYFPMHEGFRETVLTYKTFPLWNPFTYGGIAALGDPEFAVVSFTFLSELLLGVPAGYRVALYVSIVISGLGMLQLSRRLGLSAPAALLTAIAYPVSTTILLKFVEGHIQHIATAWISWVLWAWLMAYQERVNGKSQWWHTALTGGFLALMFYQGGIYMLFYIVPALIVLIPLTRNWKAAFLTTLQAGFWSAGLSAFKLLPVWGWIQEYPDDFYHISQNTIPYWSDIFLRRHLHGSTILPDQGGGWHEYGAYIGPWVLALALIGVGWWRERRMVRVLVIGLGLSALTAASGFALSSTFDVLTWLPRSNISRIALFSVVCLALLAGFGLEMLWRQRSRWGRVVAFVLLGLVALDVMSLGYRMSEQAFIVPETVHPKLLEGEPIMFTDETQTVRLYGADENRSYAAGLAGFGTVSYRPPLSPPISVVLDGQDGDQYLTVTGEATAELISWTPNKVRVVVQAPEQTRLILNGNYSRGWQVNGGAASNFEGRVGVALSPGEHDVEFRYRPAGMWLGLVISLMTMGLIAFRSVSARKLFKQSSS